MIVNYSCYWTRPACFAYPIVCQSLQQVLPSDKEFIYEVANHVETGELASNPPPSVDGRKSERDWDWRREGLWNKGAGCPKAWGKVTGSKWKWSNHCACVIKLDGFSQDSCSEKGTSGCCKVGVLYLPIKKCHSLDTCACPKKDQWFHLIWERIKQSPSSWKQLKQFSTYTSTNCRTNGVHCLAMWPLNLVTKSK